MSSRLSNHPDRRTNVTNETATNGTAAGAAAGSRPRMTSTHNRTATRSGHDSPQSGYDSNSTTTAHKRSASGNPRSRSATVNERRTERVTTKEKLVSRTKSPDRRTRDTAPPEKWKPKETVRPRTADGKQKEPVIEAPSKPWDPVAALSPHTSAPLANRIIIPPLASEMPAALQPEPLHDMSLEAQEAAIIEDLLFVFMGYEGQYIRFAYTYKPREERDQLTGPSYKTLPGLDPSLEDLTQGMLKMASHYSALEYFVDVQSREEFGAVNHALCAAIRKFLQEYLVMIAQLETQFLTNDTFTLHVLNIHTLPTSQMMSQLYSLAHEFLKRNALLDEESEEDSDPDDIDQILENLKKGGDIVPGGIVIGLITKRLETMSGDPAARTLLTSLLRDATRPYMSMLNEWLHRGGINDPHSEFLVKEQKSIKREIIDKDYTDDYWERRYTLREQDIPPQLLGVKDKVLLAGKYLNVVRECGGVDVSKVAQDLPTSFDDPRFLDNVNNAYAYANESLMRLLLTTHSLPARLQSLKHYFFLDPSDYFTYFLELGASELRKPVKSVNTVKLQSLLDIVLRQPGTIVSMDAFKEDVYIEMNEVSLIKMLQRVVNITGMEQGEALQPLGNQPVENDKNANGFTSLQLNYNVPFPVSLVISRKTIWRYQALFRYLLSLRHLESQLSTTWHSHNRGIVWCHKSSSRSLEIWKRRVWTLRARMIVFVQQLLYFCTLEVIEPNWQALMSRLRAKDGSIDGSGKPDRTVDELMQDHVDFLDTCLKGCMLTNGKLIRIHSKLMQTCTIFATYTNWLSRELEKADPDLIGNIKPPNMSNEQWKQFQIAKSQKSSSSHNDSMSSNSTLHDEETKINNLFEIIKKWETNFSRHLQILLDALNHYAATETVVLLSLCARLATANQGTEYAGLRNEEDIAA
ncbi:spindle pole body component alp4 [Truncatella angustata]|uniref:Spindle pole body component n=1 Tax=Truncatella angustata TaxID=152316 RepID=A0A9P9A1M1_9PEZI|nr:spindle pole body component alp4 [Truncatella angustata]KAH6659701.1 spindle pole body component alp4 [Truncatella angustata]